MGYRNLLSFTGSLILGIHWLTLIWHDSCFPSVTTIRHSGAKRNSNRTYYKLNHVFDAFTSLLRSPGIFRSAGSTRCLSTTPSFLTHSILSIFNSYATRFGYFIGRIYHVFDPTRRGSPSTSSLKVEEGPVVFIPRKEPDNLRWLQR